MIAEKINNGIKEALRSKDQVRLNVLRMLKSKILAVDARAGLSDLEVVKLFKTYYGNLAEACEQAQGLGRIEAVSELKQEMAIVQEFLPRPLSYEEIKEKVEVAISNTGAKTRRDFGLVMKEVLQLAEGIDGKIAKKIIEEMLPE